MTRRTFNYTGRKRIPQKHVSVVVGDDNQLTATWDIKDFGFPADARVYLEAISTASGSPVVLRFPYGTVGNPHEPADRSVKAVAAGSFAFNLKVVDESDEQGLLLGLAENIRPAGEGDEDDSARQQPLLPVVPSALGSDVWRLTFAHQRPWLEVNNAIPDVMVRIRTDEVFVALVYPAVVREILFHILVLDEFTDPDSDATNWRAQWLRWAIHWHSDHVRPAEGTREENEESWMRWIATVVSSFCRRHDMAGKYARGGERGD